jgi:DNA modification methylase
MRSVSDLKPSARNPRRHPKKQVDDIVRSISTFGFTNPILIDEHDEVIAGHGRLIAAKKMRLNDVPTLILNGLNDEQKRALRIADNKIAQGSSWDTDLLNSELVALSEPKLGFDISLTGFSGPEIDVALRRVGGKIDDAPGKEWAPPTAVQTGDIWLLGQHRIACGDCRDQDLMARLMHHAVADVAFLDPPYNVPISGFAVARGAHADFGEAVGEMSPDEFTQFLSVTLGAAARATKSGGVHFVAMDWRHLSELHRAGEVVYSQMLNMCVWNKSNAGMGSLYRSKHELIMVFKVGDEPYFNAVELGRHGRNRTNVWDYSSVNTFNKARQSELKLHPTVKPAQMVADAILDVSQPGELVLDTFLGSGTTLVAAEQTRRRFCGVEIDPGYIEVAMDRWARLTCMTPTLEATGETLEEVQLRIIPEPI